MKIPKPLLVLALWFAVATSLLASVPSSTTWVQYTLTTNPQTLTVPFVFQNASDLLVLDSKASPPVTLTLNSDYSVSGGSGSTGTISTISGGANAVQVGDKITISRRVPLTQAINFVNGGPITASMVGQAVDKLTTISQQLNLVGANSLQFQPDEQSSGVLPLTLRANTLLGFDNNGAPKFYPTAQSTSPIAVNTTVTSIASLRGLLVTGFATGQAVQVSGYYAPNDGGGGLYVWNSASTATDNGGTVIQATGVVTGRWLLQFSGTLDARVFGAKFDNSNNDAPAIQSALTVAGTLVSTGTAVVALPPGTAKCTSTLTIPSGVTLRGSGGKGNPATISGLGTTVIHGVETGVVVSLIGSSGCRVEHLGIYGDSVTVPKVGLQLGRDATLGSAGDHDFTDVLVSGYYSGTCISSVASENNNWYSCLAILNGGGGVWGMLVSQGDPFSTGAFGGSNEACNYFGLDIINYVASASAVGLYVSTGANTKAHNFYGNYIAMKQGAYVYLSVGVADAQNCPGPIAFYGCSGEQLSAGNVSYGFEVNSGGGTYSISGVTIESSRFLTGAGGYFIRLDSGANLTTSRIICPTPAAGGTLSSAGSLTNTDVNFGSSRQLFGDASVSGTLTMGNATVTGTTTLAGVSATSATITGEIIGQSPSTSNPSTVKGVNTITIANNGTYSVNTAFQCGVIVATSTGAGNCALITFGGGNAAQVTGTSGGSWASPTLNNAGTVNFYYAAGGLTIQNLTGSSVNLNLLILRTL